MDSGRSPISAVWTHHGASRTGWTAVTRPPMSAPHTQDSSRPIPMMIGKSRPRSMKMPGSRSHALCRDGLWQTPALGAREPGDHRCEGLHRLARHHDVGEAPPLAALQKPLT